MGCLDWGLPVSVTGRDWYRSQDRKRVREEFRFLSSFPLKDTRSPGWVDRFAYCQGSRYRSIVNSAHINLRKRSL